MTHVPWCMQGSLTHLLLVPHICVNESDKNWFGWWLVVYSAPSHYLNRCWDIVNWTLRHKLQWKCNQNTIVFTHENAFENIVCEMAAIFCRGRWAKKRFPLKSVLGKRSRHPRCMRNPQFCVSGNRPIQDIITMYYQLTSHVTRMVVYNVHFEQKLI